MTVEIINENNVTFSFLIVLTNHLPFYTSFPTYFNETMVMSITLGITFRNKPKLVLLYCSTPGFLVPASKNVLLLTLKRSAFTIDCL